MFTVLTASGEDYLERILELVKKKGYARVSDIAEELAIKPASVTKMLQKLEALGYIVLEKYRGLTLTEKGKRVGRKIGKRHTILHDFLTVLGVSEKTIEKDIDGLEHHLSNETVHAIEGLLSRLERRK